MKKILIIKVGALGDVIFALPLAQTLKSDGAEIGWLIGPKAFNIIKGNPCVDHCHFVDIKKFRRNYFSLRTYLDLFQVVMEIRKLKYDIALDCGQGFKNLFMFIILLTSAKRRITVQDASLIAKLGCNEYMKTKAPIRDHNYHIVERHLDFARHLGINPGKICFSLPETTVSVKSSVDAMLLNLDPTLPIVVISPATSWVNKHWADNNWADLIRSIDDKCNLIIVGSDADAGLIAWTLSLAGADIGCLNLAGKTNILELQEIFMRSRLVISPDSGGAHLAWATGGPAVITIFTCTPPGKYRPFGQDDKYFSVSGGLSCQPCYNRICPLPSNRVVCQNLPSAHEVASLAGQIIDGSVAMIK